MNISKLFLAVVLSIGLLFAGSSKTAAQVSGYSFSQTNGTYTTLANPLVFVTASSSASSINGFNLGSHVDSVSTLPFTFRIGGYAFTKCYISASGYIAFGTAAPPNATTLPISSTPTNTKGVVAAWGRPLKPLYNVVNNGVTYNGSMSWATLGTAPNRKIVFQWKNFHPTSSGSSSFAYSFDFQVALEETTNNISVTYGGSLSNLTGTSGFSGGAQVGLKGSSNSDFNNRTNSTSTAFTSSAAGTTNTATQSFNTSTSPPGMPASGLTYTWTPPSCFGPTSVTIANVAAAGATLNWLAPSPVPASGYEYEVRSSGAAGSGATGLAASGTTTSTTLTTAVTGLSPTTTYTAYVRGNCGTTAGSSVWTASTSFTTPCATFTTPYNEGFNGGALPDCWTNSNSANSTNANLFWKFNSYNSYGTLNNGRPAGSVAYVDADPPTSGIVTLTSPFISLSGLTTPFLKFDWFKNNPVSANYLDNKFQVEGYNGTTWISLFNDTSNSTLWRTVGISLPASFNGATAAQFRFKVDKSTSTNNSYDDILLDSFAVTEKPACLVPGNSTVTSIAATTATITWIASAGAPSSGYQYEVRSSGAAGSGATGLAVSGSTAAGVLTTGITGLTVATNYVVYVRANCGTTAGTSVWNGGTPFKTLCNAASAPFSEGFNGGALPDCWTNTNSINSSSATLLWKFGAGFEHGTSSNGRAAGTVAFVDADIPNGSAVRLTSPVINLSGVVTPFFKFDWFKNNTNIFSLNINSELQVEGYDGTSWVSLFTNSTNSTLWRTVAFALPAGFTGITNAQFRFVVNKNSNYNPQDDILIDSFSITEAPVCPQPTAIAFSSAGSNGSISWGAPTPAPAGGYKYELRTLGPPGSGAVGLKDSGSRASGTNFATVTGLTAGKTYTAYVRSDCGFNSTLSSWVSLTITVPCFPLTTPVLEEFRSGVLPDCWTNTNSAGSSSANLLWKFGAGFDHGTLGNGRPAGTIAFVDADAPHTDTVTLTTPVVNFGGIFNPLIRFDWFKNNTGPAATRTNNLLLAEGYNGVNWVPLFSDTSNSNGWRTVEIPLLNGFSGVGNAQFRFRVVKNGANSSYDDVLLDNFVATISPTCGRPSNVVATATSGTEATVTWTQIAGLGNPAKWQISYGGVNLDPFGGTKILTTTNSGVLTGLTPATYYEVYVRALCGGTDNSEWSFLTGFTTGPSGIRDVNLDGELTLFPNPASEFVTIQNSSAQEMKHLTVLNVVGAVVRETAATNGKEQRINITGLAAGTYLVRIQLSGTTVVRRLQIMK